MDLENTFNEIGQAQKDEYYVILVAGHTWNRQTSQGPGEQDEELLFNGYRIFVGNDASFGYN